MLWLSLLRGILIIFAYYSSKQKFCAIGGKNRIYIILKDVSINNHKTDMFLNVSCISWKNLLGQSDSGSVSHAGTWTQNFEFRGLRSRIPRFSKSAECYDELMKLQELGVDSFCLCETLFDTNLMNLYQLF